MSHVSAKDFRTQLPHGLGLPSQQKAHLGPHLGRKVVVGLGSAQEI